MFWPPRPGTQAAAHERHVGQPPDRGQLADRVDQDDRRRCRRLAPTTRLVPSLAAPDHASRRCCSSQRGHAVESLGVPGHQDQPQAGVLAPGRPVRGQRGGLFAFHRAAGHEHQVGVRAGPASCAKLARLGVVPVAFQAVVLHRAGDADPIARERPARRTAGRSRRPERPRRRCDRSVGLQRASEAAIAAVAAGAEPGVDDRHLGPGSLGRSDQVRPELELDQGQHGRPDPRDRAPVAQLKSSGA